MKAWLGIVISLILTEARNQFQLQSNIRPIIKRDYQLGSQYYQKMSSSINPISTPNNKIDSSLSLTKVAISSWGVLGVVTFIANALQRLIPIALQPLVQGDLTLIQMTIYLLWTIYMIYVEGYKAFHLKFSPFVVKRSLILAENPSFLKFLFAGPYCMGLFGATQKRMVLSWSLLAGVFALVKVVKLLPYPWRSIVDAGVVCGLSLGTLSMIYHYILALLGRIPSIDADIPEDQNPHRQE